MHDAIKLRAKIPDPATWYWEKRQIDGVFLSCVLEYSKACFLPLWSGIGNHQPIIWIPPSRSCMENKSCTVVQLLSRHLQCGQPKPLTKYIPDLMKYLKLHKIDVKLQSLRNDMHLLSNKKLRDRSEAICSIKSKYMLAAEKCCRRFRTGIVDYSPSIIKLKKKGYFWILVVKKLEGAVVNNTYICQLAHQVKIPSLLVVSLEEATKLRKQCYDESHRLNQTRIEIIFSCQINVNLSIGRSTSSSMNLSSITH